jgi:23S rRNA (adenine2030-N6)-methyltransferase
MPWLVKALGQDAGARFTLESGTQTTGMRSSSERRPPIRQKNIVKST